MLNDVLALFAAIFFFFFSVQSFSLHVFAKRPIEPITKLGDFRRAIMKRIALAALQIRLSVNSRADPPYLSVEFNQLDSPREVRFVLVVRFFSREVGGGRVEVSRAYNQILLKT